MLSVVLGRDSLVSGVVVEGPDVVAPATTLSVGVLGSLRIVHADGLPIDPATLRTSKTRHLLRLLALEPEGVRTDVLIEQLWPEVPTNRGRGSLRTAASQLRTSLGGHVVRNGDVLVLDDVDVDVVRFTRHAERAHRRFVRGDQVGGLSAAASALAVYRGDLAADEPYLDAIVVQRERLALRRDELLLGAAEAALGLERTREALRYAERAIALDATSERACRSVMLAYERLGERSMALRAYDRCRQAMAAELGIAPGPRTLALRERLLAGTGPARSAQEDRSRREGDRVPPGRDGVGHALERIRPDVSDVRGGGLTAPDDRGVDVPEA